MCLKPPETPTTTVRSEEEAGPAVRHREGLLPGPLPGPNRNPWAGAAAFIIHVAFMHRALPWRFRFHMHQCKLPVVKGCQTSLFIHSI